MKKRNQPGEGEKKEEIKERDRNTGGNFIYGRACVGVGVGVGACVEGVLSCSENTARKRE